MIFICESDRCHRLLAVLEFVATLSTGFRVFIQVKALEDHKGTWSFTGARFHQPRNKKRGSMLLGRSWAMKSTGALRIRLFLRMPMSTSSHEHDIEAIGGGRAIPLTLSKCPICEGAIEVIRLPEGVSHWGRNWCPNCQTTRGFAETPPDQAASWRMPIGKFAGWSLAEIDREPRGRSYLKWMCENIPCSRGMIVAYLSQIRESTKHESSGPLATNQVP